VPTIELPINPEVLIWARMEAGLVPEEAAGISRIPDACGQLQIPETPIE
jgi:hypothetical protein